MGMYIDEIAHFPTNGIVEIDEILPLPLEEERPQLIFIVFQKGRIAVG